MGNRDVCGVPGVLWGGCRVEGGRGGVNLDVSGDRAPRLGSSSLLEVRCVLLLPSSSSCSEGSATYQSTLLAPQQGLGRSKSPRANTTSIGTAPEWRL